MCRRRADPASRLIKFQARTPRVRPAREGILNILKLIDEHSGTGELSRKTEVLGPVRYTIAQYQGFTDGSGMPVPGVFRVEGSLDFGESRVPADLVGVHLTLRLENGRALRIMLTGTDGRILNEGNGPIGCSCC
jgi:hypothetical protein